MTENQNELWAVSVRGPDDLLAMPNKLSAHRVANYLNEGFTQIVEKRDHPYNPHIWASPVLWPYSSEGHAEGVATPSEDYAESIKAVLTRKPTP